LARSHFSLTVHIIVFHCEKVIPQWCEADALHIATATYHNSDLLLSWNFKHIVNVTRIMGYNSVNLREGYKSLEIRSPKEVIYDE